MGEACDDGMPAARSHATDESAINDFMIDPFRLSEIRECCPGRGGDSLICERRLGETGGQRKPASIRRDIAVESDMRSG